MLLSRLHLTNLLSFGPDNEPLDLGPLNVLIGPNGSGKSNLIDAIGVLQAAPRDLAVPLRAGGGVDEWLWKGGGRTDIAPPASIEALVDYPGRSPLRYRLAFTSVGHRTEVQDERVESDQGTFFAFEQARPSVLRDRVVYPIPGYNVAQSVLSQILDAQHNPEIHHLGSTLGAIRLYREWTLGRSTTRRAAARADDPSDGLLEDGTNLALIINRLRQESSVKPRLLEQVRLAYEGISDVDVLIVAGIVQLLVHENGRAIPQTRLSDGTLRWLSLLAILLDPTPPPLVCIEEPELGLHPDLLPKVADLLREASARMQLVVTTHSDTLVDALTETPEAVVVCERPKDRTVMRRLTRDEVKPWLEQYRLGQAWASNLFGGNRW